MSNWVHLFGRLILILTYKYFKYFLKVIFDIFANFSIFNKVPVSEALYILDNKGR